MLKRIMVLMCLILSIMNISFATEEIIEEQKKALGLAEFVKEAEGYTNDVFPDFDMDKFIASSIKGDIDLTFMGRIVKKLLSEEILNAIKLMISVLIIIIINSVSKAIIENLGNEETAKIVYLLQYLVIVTLVANNFIEVLKITKEAITKIINFMNLLVPLFTTLMLTTGSIASSSAIQPILLFIINFIGNFCNTFLIPLLLIFIVFNIVSNVSEKVQISSLAKFIKSTILWVLGIILTVFTCVLSLEGTLTASVDGLTSKTAKVAVSNFIPVVGKILGDTVETVIGCSNILKNTVGFVGVIIIIGIVALPIIRITVFTFCFKLTSSIGEAVAEPRIVKLISGIADGYKILLAILFSVSVMFIIGITIVLTVTNSSIMYR